MYTKNNWLYIAETAGFCWGVKRAVDLAISSVSQHKKPIYTFGPLIHNPQTLKVLQILGIGIIEDLRALPASGSVIIRAHGIPPDQKQVLEASGLDIIDATCPRVRRVQNLILKHRQQGQDIYICGDKDHAEVKGLVGYARGGTVICLDSDPMALKGKQGVLLAQTTLDKQKWDAFCVTVKQASPSLTIYDTVCEATFKRQKEAREIAEKVKLMVVIGGRSSANTKRLVDICSGYTTVRHITDPMELAQDDVKGYANIGVTAGASTPNFVIQNTIEYIEAARKKMSLWARMMHMFYLSDVYSALGLAGLVLVAQLWLKGQYLMVPFVITCLFLWGVLLFNHVISEQNRIINDILKIRFYNRFDRLLKPLSIALLLSAILLSAWKKPLFLLFFIPMVGFSYTYYKPVWTFSLRSVRASKDILLSAALSLLSVFLPLLYQGKSIFSARNILPFVFIYNLVFVRSLVFNIRDIYIDRIFGRETLAILIGKKRTMQLIIAFLILQWLLVIASCLLYDCSGVAVLFAVLAYLCLVVYCYFRKVVNKGLWLDIFIDSTFLVALIAAIIVLTAQGYTVF